MPFPTAFLFEKVEFLYFTNEIQDFYLRVPQGVKLRYKKTLTSAIRESWKGSVMTGLHEKYIHLMTGR